MQDDNLYADEDKSKNNINKVVDNMKDLEKIISLESCEKILSLACKNDYEIEQFEGGLLDSYLISYNKTISINRAKPRRFIAILEEYVNEWTSQLRLVQTDNEEKINDIRLNLTR